MKCSNIPENPWSSKKKYSTEISRSSKTTRNWNSPKKLTMRRSFGDCVAGSDLGVEISARRFRRHSKEGHASDSDYPSQEVTFCGSPESRRHVFSGKYQNVEPSESWEKLIQSTQKCTPSGWDKYWSNLTTFTKSGILEKLEDGSKRTRRLPRLGPKYEVSQILGEIGPIESGGSPEEARAVSGRSEDLSSDAIVWAEARTRQ